MTVDTWWWIAAFLWAFNAVMYARLARILYIRRRYSDQARIARFNRAFERFKCL